jgi:hypothetical protein
VCFLPFSFMEPRVGVLLVYIVRRDMQQADN